MEDKNVEFEKKLMEMLNQSLNADVNKQLLMDEWEVGVSMYHTDKDGVKRRIEPFSKEWNEIEQQIKTKSDGK